MGKLIAMAGSMAREGPIIFAKIATVLSAYAVR